MSNQTFRTRALMLDLARLPDRQDRYFFWLPWLAEWGYNTLHLHLCDDEGCALVFPRRPELATPGAFTAGAMRAFVREAWRQGITVIPEIETLGHTRFITGNPHYKALAAKPPRGQTGHAWGFNSLDPAHPETRRLLSDLIADTAEIFDAEIVHAGLDEVDLSRLRGKRANDTEPWRIFADHAQWVHEAIRRVGRRPAMWADHVLLAPEMTKRFERDVLMVDWHYEAAVRPDSLDALTSQGFEVWAAPATLWWRARLLSNAGNFANVRAFTAQALERRKKVTGMVNTVWTPYRHLPGAMDWPIAWAGHVFSAREEDPAFCRHFCRSFYGLSAGQAADLAAALTLLHGMAPDTALYEDVLDGRTAKTPRFTREHRRLCTAAIRPLAEVARALARGVRQAGRNAERLNDVVLSVRLLERWARYGASGLDRKAVPDASRLRAACRASWIAARPSEPDIRLGGFQHAFAVLDLPSVR